MKFKVTILSGLLKKRRRWDELLNLDPKSTFRAYYIHILSFVTLERFDFIHNAGNVINDDLFKEFYGPSNVSFFHVTQLVHFLFAKIRAVVILHFFDTMTATLVVGVTAW